ncbi:MAG TPA: hypothetical protein DCL77_07205 [Prolixibacteraceae bacterium]|nr:hypothetical protein [Prolixibacteraceae bacterium]
MNPESIIRRSLTIKENTSIAHSLSNGVSMFKLFGPIEFPKMGQLHFTSLYKPLVNLVLEIISFLILLPVLFISCLVLLITGKFEAFTLRTTKKEYSNTEKKDS